MRKEVREWGFGGTDSLNEMDGDWREGFSNFREMFFQGKKKGCFVCLVNS